MSNEERSHVALGVTVCPVCDAEQDNNILLDRTLRPTLPKRVFTGFELCERCTNMERDGYLALVEILPESPEPYKPDTVKKTGRLAHVRRRVASKIFSVPIPDVPFIYVEQGVVAMLESIAEPTPDENPGESNVQLCESPPEQSAEPRLPDRVGEGVSTPSHSIPHHPRGV